MREWNSFEEEDSTFTKKPSKNHAFALLLYYMNIWARIVDILLVRVSPDEIEEVIELRKGYSDTNLFRRIMWERAGNLELLGKFRLIFTKVLFAKFTIGLYLYNNALIYFTERGLIMPEAVAQPFGQTMGSMLRDQENQIWLYLFYALWLAIAVQLLVTAVAWDYKDHWIQSAVCYAFGIPIMITFLINFAVLHL